ncbi:RNA-binding protein 41-like [Ptychodera flava]|uniref:RNA-binding protein 41-like n=1 Tax=Ptychodera flava TaxID=63121 RepID=UPI003969C1E0
MEDSTSYHRTGIPRGDRRRYRSRGVTRTSCDPGVPYEAQALDGAGDEVVTEAEIQLQKMLHKQLDTNVTLEGQLSQTKTFTEGTTFKPFIERAAGELSLEEFSKLQAEESDLEHLRQCGLSEDEIAIKLHQEGKTYEGVPSKRSKLGMAPAAYRAKLSEIERKIQSREEELAETEPERFASVKVMSRHEMEIEKSLFRGTDKADLLSHLTTRGTSNTILEHPINHLDSIAETLFPRSRKHARKSKNQGKYCEGVSGHHSVENSSSEQQDFYDEIGPKTKKETLGELGDVQSHHELGRIAHSSSNSEALECKSHVTDSEPTEKVPSVADISSTVTQSSAERVDNTSRAPGQLQGRVQIIPENEIVKNRLSTEEIRNIPRFKDYTPGKPNKVLYLKNLSPGVTESDLISMFIRYQSPQGPKILFRLLTGRMKGQAFITFNGEETAGKAMSLFNGFQLKGRPIIIQYGKQNR